MHQHYYKISLNLWLPLLGGMLIFKGSIFRLAINHLLPVLFVVFEKVMFYIKKIYMHENKLKHNFFIHFLNNFISKYKIQLLPITLYKYKSKIINLDLFKINIKYFFVKFLFVTHSRLVHKF